MKIARIVINVILRIFFVIGVARITYDNGSGKKNYLLKIS